MEHGTGHARIDRSNNFDFLRVLFAVFVLVSHSYPLYGLPDTDWLSAHTNTVSFSNLGLGGFFCISGYLVYQSAVRSSGFKVFIYKRILRIFPGLLVAVLLTALLLGPIVTQSLDYFRDPSVYSYIVKNVCLYNLQFCIEGVFKNNPYSCSINGSLWTLCYEFSFYLLFIVFFIHKRAQTYIRYLFFPLFFALLYLRYRYPDWEYYILHTSMTAGHVVHFGTWFTGGILLAVTDTFWKRHKVAIAAVSFALLLLLFTRKMPAMALYFIWPLFVLSFGSCKSYLISRLDRIGDPSYGTYIYGFIVQQTLIHYFFPELGFMTFMASSVVLSLAFGYASWYLIEKKALRWKKRAGINQAVGAQGNPTPGDR